ncbi:MAG: hypothetical protein WBZ20_15225 [Nitrososphaeraceae archaeon]
MSNQITCPRKITSQLSATYTDKRIEIGYEIAYPVLCLIAYPVEFNDRKDEIVDMVSSCLYTPDVGRNKGYPYP